MSTARRFTIPICSLVCRFSLPSLEARISYAGAKPVVIDGPFTETKELVAGFWLLQAKSKAEIIEWLSRCPFENGEQIEIRQVYEMEDFARNS
jgi:hypothetical protein